MGVVSQVRLAHPNAFTMRKFTLLLFLVVTIVFQGNAQQDPQFTQNMFDRLSINPAFAGMENSLCATAFVRQQWAGFSNDVNTPQDAMLNIHAPIEVTPAIGGLGLTYFNDQLGQEKNNILRLAYSYHRPIGIGKLGAGLSVGIVNKSISSDWVSIDPYEQDQAIPNEGVSNTTYDLALGFYYKTDKLYMGISSTHLSQSDLQYSQSNFDLDLKMKRHYYVMAGYDYYLMGNPQYTLKPSIFAKSDGASTQLDLNVNFLYKKTVWLGVSYRPQDAVSPMVGYQYVQPNYTAKIGYSYDATTSELRDYSSGSHEIMLQYCFKLVKPIPERKYKNVRFL